MRTPSLPASRFVPCLISSLCVLSSPPARAVEDGAWLEKAAEAAVVKGEYPRAVALLRGLVGAAAEGSVAGLSARRGLHARRSIRRSDRRVPPVRRAAGSGSGAQGARRRGGEAPRRSAGAVRRDALPAGGGHAGGEAALRRGQEGRAGEEVAAGDQRAAGGAAPRSRSAGSVSPPRRGLRQDRRSRAGAAVPRRLPARASRRQDRRHRARDAGQGARARHHLGRRVVPVQGLHQRARDREDDAAQEVRAAAGQVRRQSRERAVPHRSAYLHLYGGDGQGQRARRSRSASCRRSSIRGRACASTAKTSVCGTKRAFRKARTTSRTRATTAPRRNPWSSTIKGGARQKLSW